MLPNFNDLNKYLASTSSVLWHPVSSWKNIELHTYVVCDVDLLLLLRQLWQSTKHDSYGEVSMLYRDPQRPYNLLSTWLDSTDIPKMMYLELHSGYIVISRDDIWYVTGYVHTNFLKEPSQPK